MSSASKPASILLDRLRRVDAGNIDSYLEQDGYAAVDRVLKTGPVRTLEVLADSGLRGRGGDGRPTVEKWRAVSDSSASRKYLLANADGGDYFSLIGPRLLEGNPQALIEGLLLGGLTVGADEALVYVPQGDRAAIDSLNRAIEQARSRGFLGRRVPGTERSFEVVVVPGRERMICGEGGPHLAAYVEERLRLLGPAGSSAAATGLTGYPLLVGSIETWVNVPLILARGAAWFSGMDRGHGTGTKLLTIIGPVARPGLIEVPLGTTLGEVIDDFAGGVTRGGLKAIHLGGLGGGFIPADQLDVRLDFESLARAGINFGSGVLRVLTESECVIETVVQMTRWAVMTFEQPLTEYQRSINRLTRVLTAIAEGKGNRGYLETLDRLARAEADRDYCDGAWSVANSISTSLRHFRDEYLAHLEDGRCGAGVCFSWHPTSCQAACPAYIDVPGYLALIAHGRDQEAVRLIREDNPFPWICGLICPHPCEELCPQQLLAGPISIKRLKAFAASKVMDEGGYPEPDRKPDSGHKVAVIGAGPAGLTAAYYLRLQGHQVTVFEALPVAGGLWSVGIPEFRLPRDIVRREIEAIEQLGVEIRLNTRIGDDLTLEDLRRDGYEAFFMAIGAHRGLSLGIEGEDDFEPVWDGLTFLRRVALGDRTKPGDKVVVVGGGNAAIDAARTAVRLGCREVTIASRRTRHEMPAHGQEIDQAEEEGVKILDLTIPRRVLGENGRVTGLECLRAELGPPDGSGRRRPRAVEGGEFVVPAEAVIAAVGRRPDPDRIIAGTRIELGRDRRLMVDSMTLQTAEPDVFAGGDAILGAATVIEAVALGKAAARSIDAFIQGQALPQTPLEPTRRDRIEPLILTARERGALTRPSLPVRPPEIRRTSFEGVELVFDEETARREAGRCLRCDLCDGRGLCQMACAEMGTGALRMDPTPAGRLVCLDFDHPARMCIGCGSCANVCPVDNIRLEDQDGVRRVIVGGTVVRELPLIQCTRCGRFYATRAYMDYISSREDAADHLHPELCPQCYRQAQARTLAGRPYSEPEAD